jgi:flagellar motor switch protein FliG
VTMAAAKLGAISSDTIEHIVGEFSDAYATGASLLGDENQARMLITDAASPEQVKDILNDLGGVHHGIDVWKAMGNLPEALLAAFLKSERPMLTTYILSKLEASLSARIVAQLPREMRNEVLVQLLAPPTIGLGALALIEDALREALLGGAAASQGDDNRARIAEIINNLDASDAEDVMKALAASRPQDAQVVRTMLFSFGDLVRLSQRARALLLDKLSTEVVVMALRGTEADFREPVLSAMASRSRRLVEGELANPTSAPAAEIDKARKGIVQQVLAMAQRGEIELPKADDTEAA